MLQREDDLRLRSGPLRDAPRRRPRVRGRRAPWSGELTKLPITFLSVIATGMTQASTARMAALAIAPGDGRRQLAPTGEVLGGRAPAPRPAQSARGRGRGAHQDLRHAYDVVIVGAGVHGLATAYYLAANLGITNVAVIDKGYVGGGGSGRNTAIVRSNYLTPDGVALLRPLGQALRAAGRRAELQRDVLAAGTSHAGPQRLVPADDALAGGGQQAAGGRLRGDRPGRDRPAGPVHGRAASTPATRSSARSTTRPAAPSATTPSTGATPAPPTPWASRSTSRPSCSASTSSTARSSASTTSRGPIVDADRRELHGGLVVAGLRDGRRRRCPSAPTRSKRP